MRYVPMFHDAIRLLIIALKLLCYSPQLSIKY